MVVYKVERLNHKIWKQKTNLAPFESETRFTFGIRYRTDCYHNPGIVTIVTAQRISLLESRRPNMTMCSRNRQNFNFR